jgi:hypothetical protein
MLALALGRATAMVRVPAGIRLGDHIGSVAKLWVLSGLAPTQMDVASKA